MTPLFWIALTWVLATIMVGRLPVGQRIIPGAMLMVAGILISLSMGVTLGFWSAILGFGAVFSLFPNPLRLIRARYRGEDIQMNAQVLRYMVVPGDL